MPASHDQRVLAAIRRWAGDRDTAALEAAAQFWADADRARRAKPVEMSTKAREAKAAKRAALVARLVVQQEERQRLRLAKRIEQGKPVSLPLARTALQRLEQGAPPPEDSTLPWCRACNHHHPRGATCPFTGTSTD